MNDVRCPFLAIITLLYFGSLALAQTTVDVGIVVTDLDHIRATPFLTGDYRIPGGDGIWVARVMPNSPARTAGLTIGDIIITIDGRKITEPYDYHNWLDSVSEGLCYTFTIKHRSQNARQNTWRMRNTEVCPSIDSPRENTLTRSTLNLLIKRGESERVAHIQECRKSANARECYPRLQEQLGRFLPTLKLEQGSIGAIQSSLKVAQVIDSLNLIVEYPSNCRGQVCNYSPTIYGTVTRCHSFDHCKLVWIANYSTQGLIDGRPHSFKGVFRYVGGKTYTTVLGSNRTVALIEHIDVDLSSLN